MIAAFVRALSLWWSMRTAYPYLPPERAAEIVGVALDVETPRVPAEILIGMGRVETRHDGKSVSRMTDLGRRTGRWSSTTPGRGWFGPFFCGVVQARAATWKRCLELQDLRVGLAAGVAELERWHRAARGNVARMLAGHGCGRKMSPRCGSHGGRKVPYPERVMREARALGWRGP